MVSSSKVFRAVVLALRVALGAVFVYAAWTKQGNGWVALTELVLFTVILLIGLVWAWAHGDLEWVKKLSAGAKPAGEKTSADRPAAG